MLGFSSELGFAGVSFTVTEPWSSLHHANDSLTSHPVRSPFSEQKEMLDWPLSLMCGLHRCPTR